MLSDLGVDVSIVTTSLEPLTEYGVQNLGKKKKVYATTKIEAITGLQFFVRVKAQQPFPLSKDDIRKAVDFAKKAPILLKSVGPFYGGGAHRYFFRHGERFNEKQAVEQEIHADEHEEANTQQLMPPLTQSISNLTISPSGNLAGPSRILELLGEDEFYSGPPPFDLIASVYIDGRSKPEARQIIYLDPKHPRYSKNGMLFKGRWVLPENDTNASGPRVGIRNWVFTDVGIDILMSRMEITDQKPSTDATTHELTESMKTSVAVAAGDKCGKAGQIEVHVRRIRTGETSLDLPFKPYHYAGEGESIESQAVGPDCTHTTSLKPNENQTTIRLRTTAWEDYKKGEDVYAKFVFQYMSRVKLMKLGLCNEDGSPKPLMIGDYEVVPPPSPRQRKRGLFDVDDEGDDGDINSVAIAKDKLGCGGPSGGLMTMALRPRKKTAVQAEPDDK